MSIFRWIGDNQGRLAVVFSIAAEIGAAISNIHLHQPVDLGPGGLGGGLAAILTASGVILAAPPAAHALMVHQQRKLALMEKKHAE